MTKLASILATAVAMLLFAAPVAAQARPVRAAAAPFVITMKAPGHHPTADKRWPVTVTAHTPAGKALRGTLRYLFLYKGRIVSRQSNYRFRGKFTDKSFVWPSRAVGIPLTLRCQITTSLGIRHLDYAVRVRD